MTRLSLGAYLLEIILWLGAYFWEGLISGGFINFKGHQACQSQYHISFFNIKYCDLTVNRDGIKEEKVGQLFLSNITVAQISKPKAECSYCCCF